MIKNKGLISVVIPVFGHPEELGRALKSVLAQTYGSFEILVVDDGSQEDIRKVCEVFNDERIRYFRNEKHVNANAARNRGIKEAKGEFVAMLDADDEFLPDHLQRRIEKTAKWKCDGIFGSAYIFDGDRERIKKSRPLKKYESMADYLLTDGFCPTPSHFYRLDAIKTVPWDEALFRNQDYDLSIRFSEKFDFRCDPSPTVRVHWLKGHKQKLGDEHFRSQKAFVKKHKQEISTPALVNFYHAMKKEAEEAGNQEALKYYTGKLKEEAPGLRLPLYLLGVRLKAAANRFKIL